MYRFPHFSHCFIISSSPKWREKRKCIYFSAAAIISPRMAKRYAVLGVLCDVVKQLQKALLTFELGNVFCSFKYDKKSLALLIAGLVSYLLRLEVKALSVSCIEDLT